MSVEDIRAELERKLKELSAPYIGKVDYGDLRGLYYRNWRDSETDFCFLFDDMWRSTDGAGVEYNIETGVFRWHYGIYTGDNDEGTTTNRDEALAKIRGRIETIPDYRKKHFIHFSRKLPKRFDFPEEALRNLEERLVVTPEEMEFVKNEVAKLYNQE